VTQETEGRARGEEAGERYDYSEGFAARARVSLADPKLRGAVRLTSDNKVEARARAMMSLKDPEGLRDLAAELRDGVLARLDEHLERLADNWEAAGGNVFFAADAAEARDYICSVARKHSVRLTVKSKSMASEEIGLNQALAAQGIEAVETDLGEWIVQLSGEHPSHIVTPALHKTKEDVADLFSEVAGERLPEGARALTSFARERLRQKFLEADMGVSGVNFAVSSAGALCTVSNEGNARMCTSLPRVHVALMGMERVVASWDELAVMLALLGRSATGQKLTQYTTFLNGPRRPAELDGPDESHLVILDNGRSGILGTRYQSALRCIRCGACLNVCPVFRQVGGHAYDPVYSGPIGAVINPLLRDDPQAAELAHASTLCGACTEACPVRIPLHDLLVRLRQDYAREDAGRLEHLAYSSWSRAWSSPLGFDAFARLTSALDSVTRFASRGKVPLPIVSRWTKERSLPRIPRASYRRARAGVRGVGGLGRRTPERRGVRGVGGLGRRTPKSSKD
jgi:L-lactate dehydrogenase complex protein LldF